MANVQISELPDITLPAVPAVTYFESETLESGIPVSRKISLTNLQIIAGGVSTVNSGTNITVDNTDPANPIINLDNPVVADLTGNVTGDVTGDVNGVTLTAAGGGTNYLADDGTYKPVVAGVSSVNSGANITIDNTDPANPIVNLDNPIIGDLQGTVNGVTLDSSGGGTNFLADDGSYQPAGGGALPAGNVGDTLYLSAGPDTYSATSRLTLEPTAPTSTLNGATPSFLVDQYANNTAGGTIQLDKSRNATPGSHTIVQSADTVGDVLFQGSDGVQFIQLARIRAQVDGTPGVNDMPGRLTFSTTTDGASGVTERMRIRNSGQVVISGPGSAYADPPQFSSGTQLLEIQGIPTNGQMATVSAYLASIVGPLVALRKSRGATLGTMTVVQSADLLGTLTFHGSDGTNFIEGASIQALVDGTPGANDMPGRLVFKTTADGTVSAIERMRIRSIGQAVFTSAGATYGTPPTQGGVDPDWVLQTTPSRLWAALDLYADSTQSPTFLFRHSRATTIGTQTSLFQDDSFGALEFYGSDGTNFRVGASIQALADGTTGVNDMPGRLVFSTTPDGLNAVKERMRISNTGQVVITDGGATYGAPPTLSALTPSLVVQGSPAIATVDRYSADNSGSRFAMRKSRNATVGSQTIVQSGDGIGAIEFYGSNGTSYDLAAAIYINVDGTPGAATDMPGRIGLYTTPDGSATTKERIRIIEAGASVFMINGTAYGAPIVSRDGGVAMTLFAGGGGAGPTFSIDSHLNGAGTNGSAELALRHSRNNTNGGHTVLQSGDTCGDVNFYGDDGSAMVVAARIGVKIDGTPGANDMPGRIEFSTTLDGAATATERMRLDNVGHLIFGAGGTGAFIYSGTGTPEGSITAPIGSLYMRTNGGAATSLYVKESGAGNTGWVGK